jgi:hypothetical protein
MTVIHAEVDYPSFIEKFARFLCDELQIRPAKVTIVPYELDDGILGLCLDESDDEFIVFVKEKDRDIGCICTTIAHEMIHVKQFLKENLNHWLNTCRDTPYHKRWWEVEARLDSVPLVEKFAKKFTPDH